MTTDQAAQAWPRLVVTVFTDASFCHRTKAAGFAVWIKTDKVTLRHAGAFKIDIATPGQAETAALGNGICAAVARLDMQPGDIIVAASDCLQAIHVIGGSGSDGKPDRLMRAVRDRVKADLKARGVELRLKHVRAHQGKSAGPRNAVNEWCDGAAKTVMRDRRKTKDKEKPL